MTNREIKMNWIGKLQQAIMRQFNEEDEDYPDGRAVAMYERTIIHWLRKMTDDVELQWKIRQMVYNECFNTDDLSFKPICNKLREMGFTIVEGV